MRTIEEFWARVDVRGPHECWRWMGAVKGGGYGSLNWRGRSVAAHRIALDAADPMPAPEACALHHCDVRLCCNPLHIYWGTYLDNNRDRARRGRNNSKARSGIGNGLRKHPEAVLRGSQTGQAVLSEDDVLRIRAERMRPCEVVRTFNISPSQAKRIVRGESWAHLQVQP